jgi:uncharacterized protein (TIGR03032 family)
MREGQPKTPPGQDLSSVFTDDLPRLFAHLKLSLAVSTYQAGKLILVRAAGNEINTHYRDFARPMGIAARPGRISIGTRRQVEHYQNVPGLVARLDAPERYDACYVPRSTLETGAIDIHEMAWGANNALWGINTRFSCLCTFCDEASFLPRWRPRFISALAPGDRCHLNGLAMVGGVPRFVTALGATDTAGGWRENKRDGGVLIDVRTNELLMDNLCMPHSPRWYRNRLWLLESGRGSLVCIDRSTGRKREIIRLPGFTRGLDFFGSFAFVGLSQMRESARFGDFPLLAELDALVCGVFVVDIERGKLAGFVRFIGDVAEIFAVQVLPGQAFPELLDRNSPLLDSTYMIPEDAMKDINSKLR